MHRNVKLSLLALLASFLVAGAGIAESATTTQTVTLTINEVAEVAVTGNVSMTIDNPGTPGDDPADEMDSSTRIQYTSVVEDTDTRVVTAAITDGLVPSGTHLELNASGETAGEGSPVPILNLDATPKNLITGIGSVATGSAGTEGLLLDYVWVVDSVPDLDPLESDLLTVTFTLADAA